MTGLGFDAGEPMERLMTDKPLPSHATFYVAHATANDALFKLALSLATNMALSGPAHREVMGREMLSDTLMAYAVAMDCDPRPIAETLPELGLYDVDEAQSIAMEIVGEALQDIRRLVLR